MYLMNENAAAGRPVAFSLVLKIVDPIGWQTDNTFLSDTQSNKFVNLSLKSQTFGSEHNQRMISKKERVGDHRPKKIIAGK